MYYRVCKNKKQSKLIYAKKVKNNKQNQYYILFPITHLLPKKDNKKEDIKAILMYH